MNIYFINKYASLKGPFDITDSHRNKIIKIGDVCLRDTQTGIAFMLVVSSVNSWNACLCAGIAQGDINLNANTLLFHFDGISKRSGDIQKLKVLNSIFCEPPLCDFFKNAIDILSYKCDFWNASVFYKIHTNTPIPVLDITNSKNRVGNVDVNRPLFWEYFNEDIQNTFFVERVEKKSLKSIYKAIREKHPNDFRQALKQFLEDNPNASIYD